MKFCIFDISVNIEHLSLLLEAFEFVYEHLIANGSTIQIFHCYCFGCLESSRAVLDLTRYIGLNMEIWREELEDKVSEWSVGAGVCGTPAYIRTVERSESRGWENWVEYDPDEYDSDVLSVDDEGGMEI
jgi:hypothetical protein